MHHGLLRRARPRHRQLTYSSAGHPPPILVHADGTTELLDDGRAIPLGVRPGRPAPSPSAPCRARATLLLYTDGLVERRRQALDRGIDRATNLHEGRHAALDELASQIMTRLAPADGYQDDVALLLYRQPAPLDDELSRRRRHLAPVRTRCAAGSPGRAVPRPVQNVLIAGEACANAIEHGHRARSRGTIRLRADALVDGVELTVADTGRVEDPRSPTANPHAAEAWR